MLVNMTEGSPIVPTESHILGIPIFPHSSSPSMPQPPSRSLQRLFLYSYNQQSTDPKQTDICQCPHVLVSDDDPFQTFFYETMFQRSISWEEILGEEESFRFELFLSGEDLIKRYNRIKGCNCGRPILIITDYNMGDKKLNGLDTIKTLKNLGFQGAIVLRTSEEKEDLIKRHSDLAEMLESKTIDHYVEKNNFKKVKEVIQALVKDLNG